MTGFAVTDGLHGTKPARQKRSREKAEKMLRAGHKLIEAHGYEGMRISDVAAEVGCSVGVFYDRFRDKESFFKLLLESNLERSKAQVKSYLAPEKWEGASAYQIIATVVEMSVRWFRRHKGLYSSALSTPIEGGHNFTPFRRQSIKVSDHLARLLETRSDEVNYPDIEDGVCFVMQMIGGTLTVAGFSHLAYRAGARIENDRSLMIDDPDLVTELTRAACVYLGVAIPSEETGKATT